MNDTSRPPASSPYVQPQRTEKPRVDAMAAAAAQTAEKPMPTPEQLASFVEKVEGVGEQPAGKGVMREMGGDGEIAESDARKADAELEMTEATLMKVADFLDPTSRGPITMLAVRHKVFAMRIPTQQEILDVTAVAGIKNNADDLTSAQTQWSIIGELKKACLGWLPEKAPEAQSLRANIRWPKKWPSLREPDWGNTRDPYIMGDEIMPLWRLYTEWRAAVVPTKEEIDFYLASLA